MHSLSTFFNRILWAIPFISFLAGYSVLSYFYSVESIKTPTVIGKPVSEALAILSHHNLNSRLQTFKEVLDLPSGTVLSQIPQPHTTIKPNQHVYLVVSTKTQLHIVPNCVNKPLEETIELLKSAGLKYKVYYLASNHPKNSCFSQSPTAGEPLKNSKIILYVSSGNNKPVVVPNFKGKTVPDCMESCALQPIMTAVEHTTPQEQGHVCSNDCIVTDQRPQAGSVISFDEAKPLHLQLQVGGS